MIKKDIIRKFKSNWEYIEKENYFTIKCDLVEPIVVDGRTLDGVNINLPKHMVYRDYEVFWSEAKVKELIKGLNNKDIPFYVDGNLNFCLDNISMDIYSNDE